MIVRGVGMQVHLLASRPGDGVAAIVPAGSGRVALAGILPLIRNRETAR